MKRIAALATAAAVAGGTLLVPVAASADPVITITSEGAPLDPGTVGGYEQPIHIDIVGCTVDDEGLVPGYIGYFLAWGNEEPGEQFEALTGPGGALVLEATVPLEDTEKVLDLNWYCSDAPVGEDGDYSILYLSPTYTYTIAADPAAAAPVLLRSTTTSTAPVGRRIAGRSALQTIPGVSPLAPSAGSARASVTGDVSPTGSAVEVTTDPNALPSIDRMGITGAKAAALKAKVDKRANDNLAVARLLAALTRKPAPTPTDAQYVTAAFQVLAGKAPAAPTMAPYVDQLADGGFRVNVVEDIALTKQTAAHYNG